MIMPIRRVFDVPSSNVQKFLAGKHLWLKVMAIKNPFPFKVKGTPYPLKAENRVENRLTWISMGTDFQG
jgi:hypothetical protein